MYLFQLNIKALSMIQIKNVQYFEKNLFIYQYTYVSTFSSPITMNNVVFF